MTPTQLRTYAEVVRLGSSKAAAEALGISEAAVSSNLSALRKELSDPLFTRSSGGLAFTPGGMRLASRAVEMLGLQDQTITEVKAAANGRRMLRIAVSSMFGEYAAPGLIELFSKRARDLDVEMSERPADEFVRLLEGRLVDLAIGPKVSVGPSIRSVGFLRYQIVPVTGPRSPLANRRVGAEELASSRWFLGPSATSPSSSASRLLARFGVPEERQLVFQSHAAALGEIQNEHGIALVPAHRVSTEVKAGRVATLDAAGAMLDGIWTAYGLAGTNLPGPAEELLRFVSTPRATQAMLSGSGANIGRFRPKVHVTLWSG